MAARVEGNVIFFGADNDSITLNCPIKKMMAGASPTNIFNVTIEGHTFTLSVNTGREVEFPSLRGYPGVTISSSKTGSVVITEIGDVLNPNYFKEDIRNWNGQGTAAVSEASEAPKKAARAKKAEVNE
nr:MAG TPA: hypothetical protein [Caudoviricetes sp.]